MVHKKYTHKKGKRYGPYLYESKRVNGKIVTTYLGKHTEKKKKKFEGFFAIALFAIALLAVLLLLFIPFQKISPMGRVTLDIKILYDIGEPILGDLKFNIKEGEFVPKDSKVVIQYGEQSKTFSLEDLVVEQTTFGNFFAEDTNIKGEGEGYGILGTKIIYPVISFDLLIYRPRGKEKVEEKQEEEIIEKETEEEKIKKEELEEKKEEEIEKGEEGIELEEESEGESLITGEAISEDEYVISGEVSKDNDFNYNLEEGKKAKIISGSVKIGERELPDSSVSLKVSDNIVKVSSDYFISEEGYGEEYLGDFALTLRVDMSKLELHAYPGNLVVELIYDDETMAFRTEEIAVGEPIAINKTNETDVTVVERESNLSLLKEIPLIRIPFEGSRTLDLSNYFGGADRYGFLAANINAEFKKNIVRISPEKGFRGARKGKFIAYFDKDSLESNEFDILVSSGAINIKTSRSKIVVGRPVKWIKDISLDFPEENLTIGLSKGSSNISVKKIEDGEEKEIDVVISTITGQVTIDLELKRQPIVIRWFKKLFKIITGRAITNLESTAQDESIEVVLEDNATNYVIEYYTEAPSAEEIETKKGKLVTIFGPDDIEYTDVIASSFLDNTIPLGNTQKIKVLWHNYEYKTQEAEIKSVSEVPEEEIVEEVNGTVGIGEDEVEDFDSIIVENIIEEVPEESSITGEVISALPNSRNIDNIGPDFIKQEIPFDAYDLDSDGKIDYIEWVVPYLSNQTFEIIVIIGAEHLDGNRSFISDIYEEVKALDGNWSETIPSSHYVRVTFEIPLDSTRDITLYPRTVSGTPRIEVYEFSGNELIAEFTSLIDNEYNKVFLTNLQGSQDTFDLLILDGDLEFDHIIDPAADSTPPDVNITFPENLTYGSNDLPLNFNVTLNENGSVQYTLDGGENNVTMFNGTNIIGRYFNATNDSIADGSYTFIAYANDTTGNNNHTENVTFSFLNNGRTACGTLDTAGTTYILLRNITTTGTCFQVTANDITLDGNGFSVSGDNAAGHFGVNATGRTDFTIQNINITDFTISVSTAGFGTNGQSGGNLTIFNSSLESVDTTGAERSGVQAGHGGNISISESNVTNITAMGGDCTDICGEGSGGDGGNVVFENTDINLTNGFINITYGRSGGLAGTLTLNYSGFFEDFNADYGDRLSLIIINDSSAGGIIKWLPELVSTGITNLSINTEIRNNSAFANSTALSALNVTANITFYGSPGAGFTNPEIKRDGAICNDCTNFTSLGASVVIFNVVSWTNYSIGEATDVRACKTLDIAGANYTLLQDITTTGTCFQVTADNITLDGNGFSVSGDNAAGHFGVNATGRTNFTIQNINITNFAISVSIAAFVDAVSAGNLTIFNSSLEVVDASGGDTIFETAGHSGNINLFESNITKSIIAVGGSSTDPVTGIGGDGGNVVFENTNINLTSVFLNITGGIVEPDVSGGNGTAGTLTLNYSGFFEDFNADYGDRLSLTIINDSNAGGIIKWLFVLDSFDITNLSTNTEIRNNSVFVNSTALSGLNVSANITLFGTPGGGFTNPEIKRDGAICNDCTNFTSLGASVVIFNVVSWTNYSIGEAASVPDLAIDSPANQTYATSTIEFNITLNEEGDVALFSFDSGTTNFTMTKYNTTVFNYTNSSVPDGGYTVNFYANDTSGNLNATESIGFSVDTTEPTMIYDPPTEDSGVTKADDYIEINVTAIDNLLDSIVIRLYNSTQDEINSSKTQSSPNYINFSGLSDGLYFYNATANDTVGNEANLATRNITLDKLNPGINLIYPLNTTYTLVQTLLNYTVSDTNLDTCWYSTDDGTTNTTVTCGTNVTGLSSGQGSSIWRVYANDSAGNENTSSVTFFVDSIIPLIDYGIGTEADGVNISADAIFVNVTVTETNEDTITFSLYNDTTTVNSTSFTDGTRNINWTSLSDGNYTYNVTVNDTVGNSNTTATRTITLDTTAPNVTINVPESKTYTTSSIDFNVTLNEDGGIVQYTLDGGVNNVSMSTTDNREYNATNSSIADGSYTFQVYANDTAGNRNDTENITFSIDTTVVDGDGEVSSGGGGGGGGGTVITSDESDSIVITPEEFSINVISGKESQREFIIINNGDKTISLSIGIEGLEEFIDVVRFIILRPGEQKTIELRISSVERGLKVGKIIIRSGTNIIKEYPVVINIKSENFLFDSVITISGLSKIISKGEKLIAQINLLQISPKEKIDVTATYVIKDFSGNIYFEESETFFVLEEKEFIKEFPTGGLPPGKYILGLEIVYPGAFATSSSQFEVKERGFGLPGLTRQQLIAVSFVVIITILVIVSLFFIIRRTRKFRRKLKKKDYRLRKV